MNPAKFESHDYAIGGKLVTGRITMSPHYKELIEDGDEAAKIRIKTDLIHQMATFMLEENLVEFTQYEEPISGDKTIAIRAYLAPDHQVRILRLANKI